MMDMQSVAKYLDGKTVLYTAKARGRLVFSQARDWNTDLKYSLTAEQATELATNKFITIKETLRTGDIATREYVIIGYDMLDELASQKTAQNGIDLLANDVRGELFDE